MTNTFFAARTKVLADLGDLKSNAPLRVAMSTAPDKAVVYAKLRNGFIAVECDLADVPEGLTKGFLKDMLRE